MGLEKKIFRLNRKNSASTTPPWIALKSLILELNDSALALVCMF